ncbi:hypothetical protein [Lysinibacillus fusiformis]|nr:hypothetical protein [Lysinibacillus fusiformis]
MSIENYVWIIIIFVFGLLGFFLDKYKYAFYVCLTIGIFTASISVYLLKT